MASPPVQKPQATLEARLAMVDGSFKLSSVAKEALPEIRKIMATAGAKLLKVFRTVPEFNEGTAHRVMQLIQETKDVACQAVILPFYGAEEEEEEDM